jgi:hypothetical protein
VAPVSAAQSATDPAQVILIGPAPSSHAHGPAPRHTLPPPTSDLCQGGYPYPLPNKLRRVTAAWRWLSHKSRIRMGRTH